MYVVLKNAELITGMLGYSSFLVKECNKYWQIYLMIIEVFAKNMFSVSQVNQHLSTTNLGVVVSTL